jgi:hypothetical protein
LTAIGMAEQKVAKNIQVDKAMPFFRRAQKWFFAPITHFLRTFTAVLRPISGRLTPSS